ncbi:MAG: hypothetical protein HQ500_01905 [Flavobacteriales bacterium]|nr:hypothetical protein [Flavobacteriales bacterium]
MVFGLLGCDGENRTNQTDNNTNGASEVIEARNTRTARVVTLPTPMQIPALLKNTKATYSASSLLPIISDDKSYYQSGVLFGMYMLDLAYSGSFTHQQASRNYFRVCKRLGDDLGLGVKITEKYVDRFERNVSRPDSLGRIVLEMYDVGHKVLIDQNKEGLGFLMVLGCYMEGMNLIMTQARDHDLILFVHLLHQQKNYGNNLLSMLDQYEIPSDIRSEYEAFLHVVSALNATDIPSVYELKSGKRTIAGMQEENLDVIKENLESFRKSILI